MKATGRVTCWVGESNNAHYAITGVVLHLTSPEQVGFVVIDNDNNTTSCAVILNVGNNITQ